MFGRAAVALVVAGCTSVNRAPVRPFAIPPEGAAQRMMQSRRYDTRDESRTLRAAGALLLDLGFTLDKSDESLGVLVASKERTAVETGQVVLALLLSVLTRGSDVPYEERQKLRASIVTHPAGERSLVLRVTFQRIVWDTHGTVTRREQLNRPEQYAEFFDLLSKSLLVEAHVP